jgi:hypothetical protein
VVYLFMQMILLVGAKSSRIEPSGFTRPLRRCGDIRDPVWAYPAV